MKVFSYQSFNCPVGVPVPIVHPCDSSGHDDFSGSSESETPNPRQDQFPRQDSTKADLSAPMLIRYYE